MAFRPDQVADDYHRWKGGESLQGLSGQRLTALAAEVQRQHSDAYTNPKHRDHQLLSFEVSELHQLAVAATPAGETPV